MKRFFIARKKSFQYAFAGLAYIMKSQPNSWIHLTVTVGVILLAIWLRLSRIEWVLLVLTIGFVWAAETVNTALEALVDLISPQDHPLAKIAKDVGATGVLILAGMAVAVGFILLGPPLMEKIRTWMG